MAGAPTLQNLKMMIRQSIIHNFPIMVEDIGIAEKIWGPDVYTLKGRTKIQRPKVVVDNFIGIQREQIENNQEFILCMYIMFINQQELFTTILKSKRFCGLVTLDNRTREEFYRALNILRRN